MKKKKRHVKLEANTQTVAAIAISLRTFFLLRPQQPWSVTTASIGKKKTNQQQMEYGE